MHYVNMLRGRHRPILPDSLVEMELSDHGGLDFFQEIHWYIQKVDVSSTILSVL
jgi:hypothetical protein